MIIKNASFGSKPGTKDTNLSGNIHNDLKSNTGFVMSDMTDVFA